MTKWWTPEQDKVLLQNYGKMTARSIGEVLGRTTKAVRRRRRYLRRDNPPRYQGYQRKKRKKPKKKTRPILHSSIVEQFFQERTEMVIIECPDCKTRRKKKARHARGWLKLGRFSGRCRSCGCSYTARSRVRSQAPRIQKNGYVVIHAATLPPEEEYLIVGMISQEHWVLEHRYIMAKEIGRPLLPNETVHHLNGVRTDNRNENLELWVTPHPSGQRASDLVKWAYEIIERYGP